MATPAYFGEMLRSFGINAVADYSGSNTQGQFQFRAVQLDASNPGNVILPAGASEGIFGIMINAPKQNESAQVCVIGETKVLLGATVTGCQSLSIDQYGRLVPWASSGPVVGVSRFGGSSGDLVTAWIMGGLLS